MKRIKSKQVYEKFYIINHMDTKIRHSVLFSLIFVKRTVFKIAILCCKKKVKNSKIRFKKLVLSWQTFQKLFDCINNIVSNGRSYWYVVSPLSLKLSHKPSSTNKTNQIFSYRNKIVYEIQQGWVLAFYCPILI